MKHVKVVNDGDEAVVITLNGGKEITVEPGGELPVVEDDEFSTQLIVIHKPK